MEQYGEKLDHAYITDGNAKVYPILENSLAVSCENKYVLTILPSSHTPGHSQENKTYVPGKSYTLKFIAALFILAKSWKQFQCPSVGEWLKKCSVSLPQNTYCSAIKINERCDHFGETQKNYADRYKPISKGYILHDTQETYARGQGGGGEANLFTQQTLGQETEEFCLWNLSSPGERTKDMDDIGLPTNFQHDYPIFQFTVNMLYTWSQSFQISYLSLK